MKAYGSPTPQLKCFFGKPYPFILTVPGIGLGGTKLPRAMFDNRGGLLGRSALALAGRARWELRGA